MAYHPPFRTALLAALAACVLTPMLASAQPRGAFAQRPLQRPVQRGGGMQRPPQGGEHLGQWMDRHSNLSPQQQQSALEREPGFRDLPPQTQQRMRDHLMQLNSMPPEQRSRLLARTEIMERLTPGQRQQFRNSVQQLGSLPVDRRRLIARAFRNIREMPLPQRQAVLNSDRFRGQFTEQERGTLSGLLAVEPYIPGQHPMESPEFGR